MVYLDMSARRTITNCSINYSPEGIFHPDRILDEYDLLYMLDGFWDIWEEDVCHHLEPGSVLLLEPGRRHYSLTRCTPHMRNLFIHFTRLPGDGSQEAQTSGETHLKLQKLWSCKENHSVRRFYEQIIETYWTAKNHRDLRLSAQLELLLCELAQLGEPDAQAYDPMIQEIIQRFYTFQDRFYSPEELASDHGLSVRTLSSRFKKITGLPVHQYQIQAKLNMARDLLALNPGRGLRDIALSFGFYDEFQFSKLYKRQFGQPPSKQTSV